MIRDVFVSLVNLTPSAVRFRACAQTPVAVQCRGPTCGGASLYPAEVEAGELRASAGRRDAVVLHPGREEARRRRRRCRLVHPRGGHRVQLVKTRL